MIVSIGQMIAVSIVHGGPGPQCLSHAVVDYLCRGMGGVRATAADVPDPAIQEKLRLVCFSMLACYTCMLLNCSCVTGCIWLKIEEARDDSELHNLLDGEQFEFRFDIGLAEPAQRYTLANRMDMVRRIANHFAVVS